ncbi:hypothetical protein [Butyrivibrio sp. INlla14]|uniref:hypothetical protein n=1 Tax=Butyrivibrio sp. INlla14 TaxID=1520808 RepID=UPI000875F507|nr:hypothetical protein [Butyrivibrio sp. INlla14]SCY77225.1 hypothetical protein SAMN02910371_03809 [Butyrivibrio sp. INlla14]
MKYRCDKCFVAYMDILGFKSFMDVTPTVEVLDILQKICRSYNQVGIYHNSNDGLLPIIPREQLHSRVMSDSVVFFIDSSVKDALYGLIRYCAYFQESLLEIAKEPILCRGGISVGDMYIDNEIMVGKGLINAYKLEENCAINPRIIIPHDIVDENMSALLSKDIGNFIIFEDGYYKINYIWMVLNTNKTGELLASGRIEHFIQEGLNKYDDRVRSKLLYFERWYKEELMKKMHR